MAEKADLRRILEQGGEFVFPRKGKMITARYVGGVFTLLDNEGKILQSAERGRGRKAFEGLIKSLEDRPRVLNAAEIATQATPGRKARVRETVQQKLSPETRELATTKYDRIIDPDTGVATDVPSAARAAAGDVGDVTEAIRGEEQAFAKMSESRGQAASGRANTERALRDRAREINRQRMALEEDIERLETRAKRRSKLFAPGQQEDPELSKIADELIAKQEQLDDLNKPQDFAQSSGKSPASRVQEVELPDPNSPKGRKYTPVRAGTQAALLREGQLIEEADLAEGQVKTSGGSQTIEEARLTGNERILDKEISRVEKELVNAEAELDKLIAERKKTPKGKLKSIDSKIRTVQNRLAMSDEELRGLTNTAPSDFGQTGVDPSGTPEIEGSFEARRQVGGGVARDASEINLRGTQDLPEAERAQIARTRADAATRQTDRLLGVDSPEDIKVVRNKLDAERSRVEERLRSLGRAGNNPAAELEAQALSKRISEIDQQIGSLETRQLRPSSGMTDPADIVEAREQIELRRGTQPTSMTVEGGKPVRKITRLGGGRQAGMLSLLSRVGDRVERLKEERARKRLVATAVDDDFDIDRTIPATAPGNRRPAELLRDDPALLANEQASRGREMKAISKRYARAKEGQRQMVIQDAAREKEGRKLKGLVGKLRGRKEAVEAAEAARKSPTPTRTPLGIADTPKRVGPGKGDPNIVRKIYSAATARFGNKDKATRFMQRLAKSGLISGGKAPLILLSLLGLAGASMMGGKGDDRAA